MENHPPIFPDFALTSIIVPSWDAPLEKQPLMNIIGMHRLMKVS
jgi:hypothetical protein